MFGYIIPDKLNMFLKDYYRYRAFYCGLCKCIGHECSEAMRFATNYDMTFVSLLAHGIKGIEPEFNKEGCILNPIKKKAIAKPTDLMRAISDVNTLLIYYKLIDDETDKGKKAVSKIFVSKHYKRARKRIPQLDNYFKNSYDKLRQLENDRCDSIDRLADPFADMMRKAIEFILGEDYTDSVGELIYNIGRYVYIMDAIDDIDDDYKAHGFNPFLIGYEYKDRINFNADKQSELNFLLMHIYARIKESFAKIKLKTNEGVITNILWYGLLERIATILNADKKLSLPKI